MNKPTLILLHGALGSKKQMEPIEKLLSGYFEVHNLNFAGHGGRDLPAAYTCELFAEDVMEYIDKLPAEKLPVNIFGYSMGGYIGTYMALHYPNKINRVVVVATKYNWDAESAAFEINKLNVEKLKEKAPAFCKQMEEEHSPQSWEKVINTTREMMINFSNNPPLKEKDLQQVQNEIMVIVGDKDKTANLEDSVNVYRNLPNGKLLVLPGTGHQLDKIDFKTYAHFVLDFYNAPVKVAQLS